MQSRPHCHTAVVLNVDMHCSVWTIHSEGGVEGVTLQGELKLDLKSMKRLKRGKTSMRTTE